MKAETLRDAYDETDYEIIETGAGVEIPTATPAVLAFAESPDGRAGDVQARLERGYTFIDAYTQNGQNGGIQVSAKVYDSETNEFLKVKLDRSSIRIFPDSDELSFETFRRFVTHVGEALDTDLELQTE